MSEARSIILYGLDPGSSKDWACFRSQRKELGGQIQTPVYRSIPIECLEDLTADVVREAESSPVVIALDAPVNMPQKFSTVGANLKGAFWPFNLNPFSTRPCEKSLSSKPSVAKSNLKFPGIAALVAAMCDWEGEYKAKHNQSLTNLHDGLSVLGYQGAPHGPVVKHFSNRVQTVAANEGVNVSFSPTEASEAKLGHVYLLESHPAVTMAIWIAQKTIVSLNSLPKYKGDSKQATNQGFEEVRDAVIELLKQKLNLSEISIESDDELDALVGLANCVDLVSGDGDWWGSEKSGYFLIPEFKVDGVVARELWKSASDELEKLAML